MKLPSFQFYPGDWLKDPALRACSHAAKGVCIDTLCLMFECVPRGVLVTGASPWSEKDWAAAVGGNGDVTAGCIRELLDKGVVRRRGDEPEALQRRYAALLSDLPPGSYYSLRMVRDEHERLLTRERVRKHRGNAGGNGECNGEVTSLKQCSSSSSSSSIKQQQQPESFGSEPEITRHGGGDPPPEAALPSEDEVVAFGAAWPGDLARGVPGPVPAGFCREYHHAKSTQRTWLNRLGFLIDWQRELTGSRWWTDQWRTWSPAKLTPEAARKTRAEREADRLLASLPAPP